MNNSNILLMLREMDKHRAREKIHAATTLKTVFTSGGGGPEACKHSTETHWKFKAFYCERKSALKMEGFMHIINCINTTKSTRQVRARTRHV